ncbi:MAG TPA: hypothetical protein VD737_09760 [Steroidobacteraceae bacterium]|nr:hypothetical protein [Steroidobacteraceae bacterium]
MRPVALDWIRRRQRSLARGVLALFCLVWLQAALVPCAMALVPGDMAGAPMEHCSYCPPTPGADGDSGAAAVCTYPDGPQVDSRTAALAAPLLLALPTTSFVLEIASLEPHAVPADHRPPDRPGTPLAVSYCRYLK